MFLNELRLRPLHISELVEEVWQLLNLVSTFIFSEMLII